MNRRTRIVTSCVILVGCAIALVAVRYWRAQSTPVDAPVEELRTRLAETTNPLEFIRQAPPDVAGRYILSMASQPATGHSSGNVVILESVASDYATSDHSLGLARNAVMAACGAFLLTPATDPASARLKEIALAAAASDAPRMRSTFLAACEHETKLLDDPDFRGAIERLAKSDQDALNIPDRATKLLASRNQSPPSPSGGG